MPPPLPELKGGISVVILCRKTLPSPLATRTLEDPVRTILNGNVSPTCFTSSPISELVDLVQKDKRHVPSSSGLFRISLVNQRMTGTRPPARSWITPDRIERTDVVGRVPCREGLRRSVPGRWFSNLSGLQDFDQTLGDDNRWINSRTRAGGRMRLPTEFPVSTRG